MFGPITVKFSECAARRVCPRFVWAHTGSLDHIYKLEQGKTGFSRQRMHASARHWLLQSLYSHVLHNTSKNYTACVRNNQHAIDTCFEFSRNKIKLFLVFQCVSCCQSSDQDSIDEPRVNLYLTSNDEAQVQPCDRKKYHESHESDSVRDVG